VSANHEQTWAKLERLRKQRELEAANRKAKRFLIGIGLVIAALTIASLWLD
jgi:hypothetical protein